MKVQVEVQFDESDMREITDSAAFARIAIPPTLAAVRDLWVRSVTGTELPGMARKIEDAVYADALRDPAVLVYPDEGNVLAGAVVMQPGEGRDHAVRLEKGRAPRDMKPGLLGGPKARQGKRGRYNIIPLRPKGETDVVFRTVSDRSPAFSWIYPGIPPAGILDAVGTAAENIIEDVVRKALKEFLER